MACIRHNKDGSLQELPSTISPCRLVGSICPARPPIGPINGLFHYDLNWFINIGIKINMWTKQTEMAYRLAAQLKSAE